MNGEDGASLRRTGAGAGAAASLLLTSSSSMSSRLANEKELLVFSRFEAVLLMDSGSWSDRDKLLLWLLLCDKEFIKSSRSRCSASSEFELASEQFSFDEMLDVIEEVSETSFSMSLSRIALSTNSSEDV